MSTQLKEIYRLLELFYNGESTSEQEKELYSFFSREYVPEELISEKEIFIKLYSLNDEKGNFEIPVGLENKLSEMIDDLAGAEKRKGSKKIKLWKQIGGVAASVAILLSIVFFIDKENNYMLADTYTDPQEAYEETQRALLLVSSKLNSGFDQLDVIEENISKVNQVLEENFY